MVELYKFIGGLPSHKILRVLRIIGEKLIIKTTGLQIARGCRKSANRILTIPLLKIVQVFIGFTLITSGQANPEKEFKVVRLVSGLDMPVFATSAPNDTGRLFIVEQHTGSIKILKLDSNTISPTAFLTINGVAQGREQGLLGLAFHPEFAMNGFFFVNLNSSAGNTEVRRYKVDGTDPDTADENSVSLILRFDQPQSNHNGGWIGFGADNFLYISTGDGGNAHDTGTGHTPETGNAQDISENLLGKILRIDVDRDDFPDNSDRNYGIPITNPFVNKEGDDEIWAYGLRNPWRASFDRLTGDFYIADVGQGSREEINFQLASSKGGENYGWRLREGSVATPTGNVGGSLPEMTDPVYDYTHPETGEPIGPFQGLSVTGGYLYQGPVAALRGRYLFADFLSERIWAFQVNRDTQTLISGSLTDLTLDLIPDTGAINGISSFGEDAVGNVYIVDRRDGEVFKIVPDGDDMELVMTITKGWNLISVPIATDLTINELFGDVISGNVWRTENTSSIHTNLNSKLEPKLGYWLFSKINITIPIPMPIKDEDDQEMIRYENYLQIEQNKFFEDNK